MYIYVNIYTYIVVYTYIYIYNKYSTNKKNIFLQKDAHRFTILGLVWKCLCVCVSRGKPSIYLLLNIG